VLGATCCRVTVVVVVVVVGVGVGVGLSDTARAAAGPGCGVVRQAMAASSHEEDDTLFGSRCTTPARSRGWMTELATAAGGLLLHLAVVAVVVAVAA
jgi:hypothetical protein